MANITKRGNSYRFRVSAGYSTDGKQIFKTMTWTPPAGMSAKRAEKEAQHQAALFEEQVRTGQTADNKRVKFQDFAEKWFTDYAETQLRRKTIASYRDLMKRIYPALGHLYLDKIRPAHLTAFYRELTDTTKESTYKARIDLRSLLKGRGYSLVKFSEEFGVSRSALTNACKGKNIGYDNAAKIAAGLNMKLSDLFDVANPDSRLSPATVGKYHRVISSIMQTAVEWQYIVANPCERVKPPKVPKSEAAFLTVEQAIELLDLLQDAPTHYRCAVTVLLFCGFRRGELLGLTWDDIDFEHHTINVDKATAYLPEYGVYDDDTKNESSERVIKVSDEALSALREMKTWQTECRLAAGSLWKESDKVFTNPDGGPIHPDTLSSWFHDFIEKTDLPQIHIHSLRHTFATLHIGNGEAVTTVSGLLGHASPNTTTKIYAHSIRSAQAAAADALQDLLRPKDHRRAQ